MKRQPKKITIMMFGSFPSKGTIEMERRINAQTMAKILTIIAEDEQTEQQQKIYEREVKKQNKIVSLLN